MTKSEKNLYIKISEFGTKHFKGFSYEELKTELKLNEWEDKIVKEYMLNALKSGALHQSGYDQWVNPSLDSMFFAIENKVSRDGNYNLQDAHKFILKYDAYFNYIDYLEFQEALKSSKTSTRIAIAAIIISAILALASILIQFYGSVKLDSNQLNKITNQFENKNSPK